MAISYTAIQDALKTSELYWVQLERKVQDPLIDMAAKTKWVGQTANHRVMYTGAGAVGYNFTEALAAAKIRNAAFADFTYTPQVKYNIQRVDCTADQLSMQGPADQIRLLSAYRDTGTQDLTRKICQDFYGNGYVPLGRIKSFSTTAITLYDSNQPWRFRAGQRLTVSDTVSGATRALGSSGNPITITKVDAVSNKLTFGYNVDDATNGIPAIAAGDYLFVYEDRSTSASTVTCMTGLAAWTPSTAGTIHGVDTSLDPKLHGQYVDMTTSDSVQEALEEGLLAAARAGSGPSVAVVSYEKFSAFSRELGTNRIISNDVTSANVGFQSFTAYGQKGPVKVVGSEFVTADDMFLVNPKSLEIRCWQGKLVCPAYADNGQYISDARSSDDSDSIELRLKFIGELICKVPTDVTRVKLPAVA